MILVHDWCLRMASKSSTKTYCNFKIPSCTYTVVRCTASFRFGNSPFFFFLFNVSVSNLYRNKLLTLLFFFFRLTDKAPKEYAVYRSPLLFWGLVDLVYDMFRVRVLNVNIAVQIDAINIQLLCKPMMFC